MQHEDRKRIVTEPFERRLDLRTQILSDVRYRRDLRVVVLDLELRDYRGLFALVLLEKFSDDFFARSVVGRSVYDGYTAVNSGLKKLESLFFRRLAARVIDSVIKTELDCSERKSGYIKPFESLTFHNSKPTL